MNNLKAMQQNHKAIKNRSLSLPQFTLGDKLVVAVSFFMLIALYQLYWASAAYGNQVEILVDGKHWASHDLFSHTQIEVPGKLGPSTIVIDDGKIRFLHSPCNGKQCVHQGWLKHGGEFAACLPNRISLRILSTDPRFDTINF